VTGSRKPGTSRERASRSYNAQVKNCQSPVFVIIMSKNLSINYCRRLWTTNVSYQGEISLIYSPLDLQLLYMKPIAMGVNWNSHMLATLDTVRIVELLNTDSPFSLLRHRRKKMALIVNDEVRA
jgi:hypothetical protein